MENIRYIRFDTSQGTGYGCFIINWERCDHSLNYQIGMSFCNPKDKFRKTIARKISGGRLLNFGNKAIVGRIFSKESGFITNAEFETIINQIIARTELISTEKYYIPGWAKKALFRGKFALGLRQSSNLGKSKLPQRDVFSVSMPTAEEVKRRLTEMQKNEELEIIKEEFRKFVRDNKDKTTLLNLRMIQ